MRIRKWYKQNLHARILIPIAVIMTLINAATVEWTTRFYNRISLGDVISLKACPLIRLTLSMLFLNDRLYFLWATRKWSNQPFTTLAMNLYVSLFRVSVKLSVISDLKCKCGCCGCWTSSSMLPTHLSTSFLTLLFLTQLLPYLFSSKTITIK